MRLRRDLPNQHGEGVRRCPCYCHYQSYRVGHDCPSGCRAYASGQYAAIDNERYQQPGWLKRIWRRIREGGEE